MSTCRNCGQPVVVRDVREGLVHTDGLYGCKGKRTVAE